MEDGTYSYTFFRDLPAALVAVRHDDLVPIKRLAAEGNVSLDGAGGVPRPISRVTSRLRPPPPPLGHGLN